MGNPHKNRRDIFWIDKDIQRRISMDLMLTLLIGGVLVYAFPVTISVMFGIYFTDMPTEDVIKGVVSAVGLPLLTLLLLLPLALRHAIRFSNRIAGPMYRFKTEIRNLLDEKPVRRVHLRKGDFFMDYANDFNQLADMIEAYRERLEPSKSNGMPVADGVESGALTDIAALRG